MAAAAAFGASTPLAKQLLHEVAPQTLAGLLYFGAFLTLSLALPTRRRRGEARLRRTDAPRLAGLVVAGGVVAPVLMLVGLDRVSGVTGSLLMNLEGPFTLVIALLVFGEHLDRRGLVGSIVIFVAAALLTTGGSVSGDQAIGVALIGSAALLWALDNNLTQSLTSRDPFGIVAVKTGVASAVNLGIAFTRGAPIPHVELIVAALALGAVSYGASVLLDAYALRMVGAAREAAVFATAPFIGVALSLVVLGEHLDVVELLACSLMGVGLVGLFRERHDHEHTHHAVEHDHVHRHDDGHHDHDHPAGIDPTQPHSHPHRHEALVHSHAHVSDAHHRHSHRA
jgi:drug/metabolite transporter (DMT)-like permease